MNVLLISIAVATVGVDFGWRRLPDGGAEYIIQLNPETLDALRDGQPVQSDVMPEAGEVRSFRIIVGNGKLRQEGPLEKPAALQLPPNPLLPNSAVKPLAECQTTYTQAHKDLAADDQKPPSADSTDAKQPSKPWFLTLFGLFASLGTNVYLGWLSWGLRQRRRAELAAEPLGTKHV